MARSHQRSLTRRAWIVLTCAATTAVIVAIGAVDERRSPPLSPATAAALPHGTAGASTGTSMGGIVIVPVRPRAPQTYRRAAFGKPWTDDQSATLGHNGCDTRNDILNRDLTDKTYMRTADCPHAVASGQLVDPYSGSTLRFTRGPKTSAKVQIDHVIPLAYAWDMGAWSWDSNTRARFANDPRNLIAVDGPANENKRDSPPGRWMPSNERFHCQYVRQFVIVAQEFHLSVDRGSAAVIEQVSSRCN